MTFQIISPQHNPDQSILSESESGVNSKVLNSNSSSLASLQCTGEALWAKNFTRFRLAAPLFHSATENEQCLL